MQTDEQETANEMFALIADKHKEALQTYPHLIMQSYWLSKTILVQYVGLKQQS